jgi:hypothetical protein
LNNRIPTPNRERVQNYAPIHRQVNRSPFLVRERNKENVIRDRSVMSSPAAESAVNYTPAIALRNANIFV